MDTNAYSQVLASLIDGRIFSRNTGVFTSIVVSKPSNFLTIQPSPILEQFNQTVSTSSHAESSIPSNNFTNILPRLSKGELLNKSGKPPYNHNQAILSGDAFIYYCKKMFKTTTTHIVGATKFKCLICGIEFFNNHNLQTHLEAEENHFTVLIKGQSEEHVYKNICKLLESLKAIFNITNYEILAKEIQYVKLQQYNLSNRIKPLETDIYNNFIKKIIKANSTYFDQFTINTLQATIDYRMQPNSCRLPPKKFTYQGLLKKRRRAINAYYNMPNRNKKSFQHRKKSVKGVTSAIKQHQTQNETTISSNKLPNEMEGPQLNLNTPLVNIINQELHSNTTLPIFKLPELTDFHMCIDCTMPFSSLDSLNAHQNIHKGSSFSCPECLTFFESLSELKIHVWKGINQQDNICWIGFCRRILLKCPFCANISPVNRSSTPVFKGNLNSMSNHISTLHDASGHGKKGRLTENVSQEFLCWYCFETINMNVIEAVNALDSPQSQQPEYMFANHINRCKSAKTFVEMAYLCPMCNKKGFKSNSECFKSADELFHHVSLFHAGYIAGLFINKSSTLSTAPSWLLQSYECKICSMKFDDLGSLNCHKFLTSKNQLHTRFAAVPKTIICAPIASPVNPTIAINQLATSDLDDDKNLVDYYENVKKCEYYDAIRPNRNANFACTEITDKNLPAFLKNLHIPKKLLNYSVNEIMGDQPNLAFNNSQKKNIQEVKMEQIKIKSRVFCICHCGIKYSRKTDLAIHGIKHYFSDNPNICPACNNRFFDNLQDLNSHIINFHQKNINCSHCKLNFNCLNDFVQHLTKVYKLNIIRCELCAYPSNTTRNYKKHLEEFHKQSGWTCFKCWICMERCYKKIQDIRTHLRFVHRLGDADTMHMIELHRATSLGTGKPGGTQVLAKIFKRLSSTREIASEIFEPQDGKNDVDQTDSVVISPTILGDSQLSPNPVPIVTSENNFNIVDPSHIFFSKDSNKLISMSPFVKLEMQSRFDTSSFKNHLLGLNKHSSLVTTGIYSGGKKNNHASNSTNNGNKFGEMENGNGCSAETRNIPNSINYSTDFAQTFQTKASKVVPQITSSNSTTALGTHNFCRSPDAVNALNTTKNINSNFNIFTNRALLFPSPAPSKNFNRPGVEASIAPSTRSQQSSESTTSIHACSVCHAEFPDKASLLRHGRSHGIAFVELFAPIRNSAPRVSLTNHIAKKSS